MNDISSDDIFLLKQRPAEQEALIHALQEKLSNREREIDHLQAQLDKLRRMNFGSRSEKSLPPYRTNGSRSEPVFRKRAIR
ncbi:hypothetical protein [Escherichia albertii]|uniref:hypothetical protein n=1 Tax=Escherichia albertii TaxID=208962 RepID=UPI002360E556|nr:hypothetical protein [Escherichia albertii]WDB91952.1 hypothetical protein PS050_17335 [Escherichia albertii]